MEPNGNMNASNGRNHNSLMNRNYRNSINQSCNSCSESRNMQNTANQCQGSRNMQNTVNQCQGSRGAQNMGNRSGRQNVSSNGQYHKVCDNDSRNMEVECACKAASKQGCHNNDPMNRLDDRFPVVMAYVPWQQWGELYEADYGLMQGTLFKELNLIFCGVRC